MPDNIDLYRECVNLESTFRLTSWCKCSEERRVDPHVLMLHVDYEHIND